MYKKDGSCTPSVPRISKYIDYYVEEIAPNEPVNEKQRFYNFNVKE